MMKEPIRCKSCDFWDNPTTQIRNSKGVCRCHAPKPEINHESSVASLPTTWPETSADEWCGEGQMS